MRSLRRKGWSWRRLAAQFGRDCRRWCRGIVVARTDAVLTDEDVAQIAALRRRGWSVRQLAAKFDVGTSTVRRKLGLR